jgi:hypothetical protein
MFFKYFCTLLLITLLSAVIVQYGNEKYLITLAGPASKKNLNAKKYFGDILLPANRTGPLISLSDKRVSFQFADGSEFEVCTDYKFRISNHTNV